MVRNQLPTRLPRNRIPPSPPPPLFIDSDAEKGSDGPEAGGGGERSTMGKEPGRCRRHRHDQRGAAAGGVCPACLRHRLLLLCPECARVRPCTCYNPPSLASSPADSSSDSSSDLVASQWLGSASMGGGGWRPPAVEVEVKKGNFPRSSSVRVAGNVLSRGGKGGGLKWLNRVFSRAVRAFGGQRKTAKVGKEQPDTLALK